MVVLLPHSKRPEYRSLKYSYPWAFENLLHTLDNTPDLSQTLPVLRPQTSQSSASRASTPLARPTEDTMGMTQEALIGHIETQVLRSLRKRRAKSQPSGLKACKIAEKRGNAFGAHKTRDAVQASTMQCTERCSFPELTKTRDRNSCGSFFIKESTWEKVGFLGERTLIPYQQKPRSPAGDQLREEMRVEKEYVHQISLKLSQPRNRDGMIFTD
mmetsp:Transcript_33548/g.62846  ORF Transcript_33548/g.62846 Transcript_33548/m.62846 type:complete len:214 (+) Transcript_33548:52-693(+)